MLLPLPLPLPLRLALLLRRPCRLVCRPALLMLTTLALKGPSLCIVMLRLSPCVALHAGRNLVRCSCKDRSAYEASSPSNTF